MDKYYIPRYLDEPTKIILWTIDEFLCFIIPFATLFLCFNAPVSAMVIGFAMVFLLRRIKGEQGNCYLYHLMYWHLPNIVKLKTTPPSFIRQFIG